MAKMGLKTVAPVLMAAGVMAGCSTGSSFVEYDERQMYSGETAGNIEFVEIGPVAAETSGFAWTGCNAMTSEVANDLREAAREVGGNAVINVRWVNFDSGLMVRSPVCTTGWGWFALAGVGGLHPWVKNAAAEGIAVYVDEGQISDLRDRVDERRDALMVEQRRAEEAAADDSAGEGDNAQ